MSFLHTLVHLPAQAAGMALKAKNKKKEKIEEAKSGTQHKALLITAGLNCNQAPEKKEKEMRLQINHTPNSQEKSVD